MKTLARYAAYQSFGDFLAARNYSADKGREVGDRSEDSEALIVMPVKLSCSAADSNTNAGPKQRNTDTTSNQKYTVSALYLNVERVNTTEPYLQIVHINTIQAPLTLLVSFDQEPLAATRKHTAKDNDYIKWLLKSRAPSPGSDILH